MGGGGVEGARPGGGGGGGMNINRWLSEDASPLVLLWGFLGARFRSPASAVASPSGLSHLVSLPHAGAGVHMLLVSDCTCLCSMLAFLCPAS